MKRRYIVLVFTILPLTFSTGCNHGNTAKTSEAGVATVDVSDPKYMDVADTAEFTGRTQTLNHVDLKARVTGYLDIVCVGEDANPAEGMRKIREGGEVKKGEVVFVIENRPFEIALAQAQANMEQIQRTRDFNKQTYNRSVSAGTGVAQDIKDQQYAA